MFRFFVLLICVVCFHILKIGTSFLLNYQNGGCHALCRLSEEYLVTQYASSWNCGPAKPVVRNDKEEKPGMRRPPSRSLSQSRYAGNKSGEKRISKFYHTSRIHKSFALIKVSVLFFFLILGIILKIREHCCESLRI